MTRRRTNGSTLRWCVVPLAFVLASVAAHACDTPVYRYAMYRWQPSPYEVYFFHDAELNSQQQEVAKLLGEAGRSVDHPANVIYVDVDLKVDPKLLGIPPDIKDAWTNRDAEQFPVPSYLVSTPFGQPIFQGRLTPESVEQMLDSPARRSLGQQLEAGKTGVLILVTNDDPEACAAAKLVVENVRAAVADGEIGLYAAPNQPGVTASSEDTTEHEVGYLEIDRSDPQELWFTRALLAVEEGLEEEVAPLAYLAYGRGRVLYPAVGPGINRDNLVSEVQFISGACSCTVKEQNPGVDLLVRYDWDGAAAALADRFGSEEGNESRFGGGDMFFPELVIPTRESVADEGLTAAEETAELTDTTVTSAEIADRGEAIADAVDEATDKDTDAVDADSGPAPPETASASSADAPPPADTAEVAVVTGAAEDSEDLETTSIYSSVLVLGGGLCVALIAPFAITLFVMRPQ